MIYITCIFYFLACVSLERALDNYELDPGDPPVWMTNDQQKSAIMDRWFVDIETATCKPFQYMGSLGNFNNFVSKAVCENHLKFTPEEKSMACDSKFSVGSCRLSPEKQYDRWYYSKSSVDGSSQNSCHAFKYTGCGGNANNFDSKSECENACKNRINGVVEGNPTADELVKVPNEFDCLFSADVDTKDPKMGIVLHKNKKQCVYSAVGENAKRGYFNDLPTCVDICVTKKVPACNTNGPFQVELDEVVTKDDDNFKEYYYFNTTKKACLPFISKIPADTIKIDDGEKNIFRSVEMCASFCPATKHIGDISAVEPCKQPNIGVSSKDDKYNLTRFFYEETASKTRECKQFPFNGKEMNLNNFKTIEDCQAICKAPLTPFSSSGSLSDSGDSVEMATEKGDTVSSLPNQQPTGVEKNKGDSTGDNRPSPEQTASVERQLDITRNQEASTVATNQEPLASVPASSDPENREEVKNDKKENNCNFWNAFCLLKN